tara:strand:+ start:331 stop:1203 length:873 start_codon:yes stop_codon:yes gene_type:complete
MIPVVIVHTSNKPYLKTNVDITGKNNKIYFIGDKSVKYLEEHPNCTFIDISQYEKEWIRELDKAYINFSSGGRNNEWLCFKRVFIIKEFLLEHKDQFNSVFHIDSDNILLQDINNYPFTESVAYICTQNWHDMRMANSIHCGRLNLDFCEAFEQLYKDIYVNKSKMSLIENKIKYHYRGNSYAGGGISDMTFYYLINTLKLIEVQDLLVPVEKNGKKYVFMNTYTTNEGHVTKNQYKKTGNVLSIEKSENGQDNIVTDIVSNDKLSLYNIHFQGGSKSHLNASLKTKINY